MSNLQSLEFDPISTKTRGIRAESTKIFSIKISFGDGYTWPKVLKSINKYGQLLYEAYWYGHPYSNDGSRSISRGEYKIETQEPSKLKKSITWLKKTENIHLEVFEESK
ncbi:MAG: hypothetical protein ACXAC2_11445 [Candidatus Kariarchaeaceae archaeon]